MFVSDRKGDPTGRPTSLHNEQDAKFYVLLLMLFSITIGVAGKRPKKSMELPILSLEMNLECAKEKSPRIDVSED